MFEHLNEDNQLIHFFRQITVGGGEYGDHELSAYLDNELIGEIGFQAISAPN